MELTPRAFIIRHSLSGFAFTRLQINIAHFDGGWEDLKMLVTPCNCMELWRTSFRAPAVMKSFTKCNKNYEYARVHV